MRSLAISIAIWSAARCSAAERSSTPSRVSIIAGGANNQLAGPEVGETLFERGMVYAPDFVINGGGIINVAGEIRALGRAEAFDPAWVEAKVAAMIDTLEGVLDRSAAEQRAADQIAIEMARERIAAARP